MRPEDFELELEELSNSCRRTGAALRELREEVNGLEAADATAKAADAAAKAITAKDLDTVRAMRRCTRDIKVMDCSDCPYEEKDRSSNYCVNEVMKDALDLIWRLSGGKLGKNKDADPARVIEALEICPVNFSENRCNDLCPYFCKGCFYELRSDAAELLRKAYPGDGE